MKSYRSPGVATLLGFLLVMVISGSIMARDADVISGWLAQPIPLNAQRSAWPATSISTLGDNGASLGICNDSQNVYFMLAFRNVQWARMIKMSGLTIWLDPQGKKKKQFMVKLVGGPSRDEMMKAAGRDPASVDPQRRNRPEGEEEQQFARRTDTAFSCFQKDYIIEKPIPLTGQEGPATAFGVDQGFFVYQFSVPLRESSVLYYGLGVKPGQTIGVGLIWGELDTEKMRGMGGGDERRGGGMGGGFPGGMGGGMGGDLGERMGGERGRSGGPGGRQMPQKQEFWLKAKLAASAGTEASAKN